MKEIEKTKVNETDELIKVQEAELENEVLKTNLSELEVKLGELAKENEKLRLHNQKLYTSRSVAVEEKIEEPEPIDIKEIKGIWK